MGHFLWICVVIFALLGCAEDAPVELSPPQASSKTDAAPISEEVEKSSKIVPKKIMTVHSAPSSGAVHGGVAGAFGEVEQEAIQVLVKVTELLELHYPDAEKALEALDAYRKEEALRMKHLGKILKKKRVGLRRFKRGVERYQARMKKFFSKEFEAYEEAVADFELVMNSGQLLRFNGAMRSLTAPLRSPR